MSTLRPIVVVLLLALALVACNEGTTDQTTEISDETTTSVAGKEYTLAYSYSPGDTLSYDVDLEQRLVLNTEGSAGAVAEEDIPASADVVVNAAGVFTFTVSEGPTGGTYAVDVAGTFDDVQVEGTADGEPVNDATDLEQLGVMAPVEATIIVDERGRIVEDTVQQSDPLGLGGSPLAGLVGDLSQQVGPALPEDEVSVGESWTETYQGEAMGNETVETTVTATLAGTEQVEGRETVVIESTSETGETEVDLSDFLGGFTGAFSDPQDGATTQDSLQGLMEDLVFRIVTAPSTSSSTTWFDPEAGVAVRSTTEGPTSLQMEVSLPEESGQLQSFSVDLEVDQSLDYRLR